MYGTMVLIRLFELSTIEIFAQRMQAGDFPGALHSSEGQEAIAVGVMSRLRPDDYVFSTYRGHGHAIAKGIPLERVAAEVHGRATGASRGFGGSMHLFWKPLNFMGGNGIVGGGIPLALGTAYAAVKRGTDQVTAVFFGDGAASQGSVPRIAEHGGAQTLARRSSSAKTISTRPRRTCRATARSRTSPTGPRPTAFPAWWPTATTCLAVAEHGRDGRRPGPARRGADADRVQDLSPPGALHGDPRAPAEPGTDRLARSAIRSNASPPGSWPRASPIRLDSTASAVRPHSDSSRRCNSCVESPLPQPTDVEEVLYAP